MRKTAQVNSRNPKKFKPTPAKFIIGPLMILFVITGCSDMPYTGSNLTNLEVNRYLVSTDGESVCFQDDLDTTCIRLTPETGNPADATNGPAVYIYPEMRVHTFYYQGTPILHAQRVGITPTLPEDGTPPTSNGGNGNNNNGGGDGNNNVGNGNNNNGVDNNNNNGAGDNGNNNSNNGGGNNGNNNNGGNGNNGGDNGTNDNPSDNPSDGHGWLIWVYYPEEAAPNKAPTLSESGVTVTLNGIQLTDEDITGFAQFIGSQGEKGIQFFYATESSELLNLKIQIEGVDSNDETIRFNINYLWNA